MPRGCEAWCVSSSSAARQPGDEAIARGAQAGLALHERITQVVLLGRVEEAHALVVVDLQALESRQGVRGDHAPLEALAQRRPQRI